MTIFDLYSKRQKRLRGDAPDVYVYDEIPEPLRVQIVHLLKDAFGNPDDYESKTDECYKFIHNTLCREYGRFHLMEANPYADRSEDVLAFVLKSDDAEAVLDVVELAFGVINTYCRENEFTWGSSPRLDPDQAILELNERFKEHGVGYQFEGEHIVRIDSTVMHSNAVKPVLVLLTDKRFAGANDEFLRAHEHYRHGRYKECLVECLKAFESTMKTICDIRAWSYGKRDTAKSLINVCFQNGLFPSFLQNQISSLRHGLESGVPTVRNKLGGHGQGAQPTVVSQYFASYQLHLTASTILFFLEAERALP